MLSRVAYSLYWISRYIERAENTARLLDVNLQLFGDFEAYVDEGQEAFWKAAVACVGGETVFQEIYSQYSPETVTEFLTFDRNNASSILSSIHAARENARMIRDQISHEMWEVINDCYHRVNQEAKKGSGDLPFAFLSEMKKFPHQFFGLIESTVFHDDGFRFLQVGKYIERADQTSRMIDMKYFLPLPSEQGIGGAADVAGWVAVLRSCSAMDAFQRIHLGEIEQSKIAEFLLLSKIFPRSFLFCLNSLDYHLRAITKTGEGNFSNEAEKSLGRMRSQLSYVPIEEIVETGLHEFIDQLQLDLNKLHQKLFSVYFEVPITNWDEEIAYQKEVQQ